MMEPVESRNKDLPPGWNKEVAQLSGKHLLEEGGVPADFVSF